MNGRTQRTDRKNSRRAGRPERASVGEWEDWAVPTGSGAREDTLLLKASARSVPAEATRAPGLGERAQRMKSGRAPA